MRIGQGIDVHPLVAGRPLVLGGALIPYERGLEGDTDGDVLTHAIVDALLGALVLGDLGTWFSPDQPGVAGASSIDLLRQTMRMVGEKGFRVIHCDSTVVAERPRLRPYIGSMRNNLAGPLGLPVDRLSIKATTTDRLGAVGRGEGILATAVVLLEEGGE